ncbi:hypothetical protein SGGMMB4_02901 [Sodalis glossinidius str. 'morsitans']|uniref:Secreted effector protein n=1 Tax=Sodalis glossinidius (strain morsitans) TaxID=343509 RepID=Q2NTG0_SODGM|nr:secreted effector protein [Sodalis glossinidius]BAE74565.1 putative secreted effector protein [Sodalis glossinidius str. 'morsitans']CRL45286.1 hypothetical protein SGGMMB4_02901 [Sodalis glossinidius str. 'morsitans']
MDEFARQLLSEGLHSQPTYLEGSALLIGYRLELSPYQVTYRVEGDVLILCALQREPNARSRPSQLFRLMGVLRRIFQALRWLVSLRMLVIADVFDPFLARKRQQLVQILLSLGAARIRSNGDLWLELSASRLLSRRNLSGLH